MTATVLIVDDLEPNIKLLEAKLLTEYYTVYSASSGQEAIDMLEKQEIDIILLDIMMPGMDGFTTCKHIKANPKTSQIPIIMVTALSEVEDKVKGLEAGADEFLTKPVNDNALFARVKSLSRTKAALDQLKLRSQTNVEFGIQSLDLSDNFNDNTILIIDDDAAQSKNIATVLNTLTSKVRIFDCSAGTTLEQMEKVAVDIKADLIIISGQISSEDPLRICAALKSKDALRYSSFVMIADDDNSPKVIKGLEIGLQDYFVYPVDKNELLARAKSQLRRKKYQDKLMEDLTQSINLSIKDGLTNAYNRWYFDSHIKQLILKAQESSRPLFLAMLDLDNFKLANDKHGHQAGDQVLKEFVSVLHNSVRITDLVARYGGEEFVIIIYDDINKESAIDIANRVRQNMENHKIVISKELTLQQTVSVGITEYRPSETAKDLIERSDKALYQAKETGRNKVVVL